MFHSFNASGNLIAEKSKQKKWNANENSFYIVNFLSLCLLNSVTTAAFKSANCANLVFFHKQFNANRVKAKKKSVDDFISMRLHCFVRFAWSSKVYLVEREWNQIEFYFDFCLLFNNKFHCLLQKEKHPKQFSIDSTFTFTPFCCIIFFITYHDIYWK